MSYSQTIGTRIKRDERVIARNLKAHFEHNEKRVEDTMSKADLDKLHNVIRYTQQFKQAESYAKMDEEEIVQRPMPGV